MKAKFIIQHTILNISAIMNESLVRAIAKSEAQKAKEVEYSLTTTDNTATTVEEIIVEDYTAGLLEIDFVAIENEGTAKNTGKVLEGFFKDTTLALDSPDAPHFQIGITGSTISITDDGGNVQVKVTGVAATTIKWKLKIKVLTETAEPTL